MSASVPFFVHLYLFRPPEVLPALSMCPSAVPPSFGYCSNLFTETAPNVWRNWPGWTWTDGWSCSMPRSSSACTNWRKMRRRRWGRPSTSATWPGFTHSQRSVPPRLLINYQCYASTIPSILSDYCPIDNLHFESGRYRSGSNSVSIDHVHVHLRSIPLLTDH